MIELVFGYVSDWYWLMYGIIVLSSSISIIGENKSPPKTIAYLLLIFLLPVLGIFVYVLFGQNIRKTKIFSRKGITDNRFVSYWLRDFWENYKANRESIAEISGDAIKLIRLVYNSEQAPLALFNKVQVLVNGEQKFEEVFKAIETAKDHIHIEYYIFKNDKIGRKFTNLLIEKVKQGVEVRLIYDSVGSSMPKSFLTELWYRDIQAYPFMPVLFTRLTSKVNYRDHRKIIVVDGKVGFVGGINVSDRYVNRPGKKLFWRDTHLKVEGDAVKMLQLLFLLNWRFVSDKPFEVNSRYFPGSQVKQLLPMQILGSGPDSDWPSIMYTYFLAITNAKRNVYITTPYLIPNSSIMTALETAALSGVDVQIIIPHRSDTLLAQAASLSYISRLLRAGVRIFRYKKGFIHAKTTIIDNEIAIIGTANMDNRSFDINFEVNAICYDVMLAKQLKELFDRDRFDSKEIEMERWRRRNGLKKMIESLARLISPLL